MRATCIPGNLWPCLIQCMYVSANPILQCRKDHVPLEKKSKKNRGRQTHAKEVQGPSLSVANHLLDFMFKLVGPRAYVWPG